MLQGEDPFLKSVAACRILASCKNRFGNRDPRITEANDGEVFASISEDENKGNNKKR